jgi:cellulose biosynthesis protein BcsQ
VLDHCVAVVNSKGGLGKPSIVANVAAAAALDGWRTLAVDLDPEALIARSWAIGADQR